MTDRVVIVGDMRAGELVDPSEIRQMIGRCGRRSPGVADLIIESSMANSFGDEEFIVSSVLADSISDLSFNLLPEIASGRISSVSHCREWIGRSFYRMSKSYREDVVMDAIRFLEANDSISVCGDCLSMLPCGTISSAFYLYPENVRSMRENLVYVYDNDLLNEDLAPAFVLGNIDRCVGEKSLSKAIDRIDEFSNNIPQTLQSRSLSNMFLWSSLMGGIPAGPAKFLATSLRRDFPRIQSALRELSMQHCDKDLSGFLDEINIRVSKNVSKTLVPYLATCHSKGESIRKWSEDNGFFDD